MPVGSAPGKPGERGRAREYSAAIVRVLWAFAVGGFRRYAQYRSATFAGAFANSIFGLLRASVTVAAVASAGGMIGGYDTEAVLAYAWLSQAVIAPVHVFAWTELAERIRTGDIVTDLSRPADLQLQFLASDLGRAAYVLLPRGLPPVVVGAVTFGLTLPATPGPYLLGLFALLMAVLLSFAGRFVLNLTAFWLLDLRGPASLYVIVSNLLCGLIVPVSWFPEWLRVLAHLTPFPSMVQTPVDLLSGRLAGPGAAALLGVQLGWLVALLLLGRLVLARATRRVVVNGG
jgi:ABC-2 type transport system permease protein